MGDAAPLAFPVDVFFHEDLVPTSAENRGFLNLLLKHSPGFGVDELEKHVGQSLWTQLLLLKADFLGKVASLTDYAEYGGSLEKNVEDDGLGFINQAPSEAKGGGKKVLLLAQLFFHIFLRLCICSLY